MVIQWHQMSLRGRQEGLHESSMYWVFVWNSVMLMSDASFLLLRSHWCPCIFSNLLHTMFFSHCSAVLCILVYMMYFTCIGFSFFVLFVNLKSSLPILSQCVLLSGTNHCWVAELEPSALFCSTLFCKDSPVIPSLHCIIVLRSKVFILISMFAWVFIKVIKNRE